MEERIEEEFVGSIPSSSKVGAVEEVNHTALAGWRNDHTGALLQVFQVGLGNIPSKVWIGCVADGLSLIHI